MVLSSQIYTIPRLKQKIFTKKCCISLKKSSIAIFFMIKSSFFVILQTLLLKCGVIMLITS